MVKKLNVGVVGCGFMGRIHSNAYSKVSHFFDLDIEPVKRAICDRNSSKVEAFKERWEYESYETDWRVLVKRDDIHMIDICTPNIDHYQIAMAAIANGKIVACEKPLAMTVEQARAMKEAVEKSDVASLTWFNYRAVPVYALIKQMISEDRLGRIFHVRCKYLQDYTISPEVPIGGDSLWRLDSKIAGSGVTGDLHAHTIDLTMWLLGNISSVCGMTETFVKERKHHETGEMVPVTIDDACSFLARFENGAMATFESTRYARGRKNQQTLEINGEKGSVSFDMEDFPKLHYYDASDESHVRGWRCINAWDSDHPYMNNWWVPGATIGYEHFHINQLSDFMKDLATGESNHPDFRDGLKTQIICEAVLESAAERSWKDIDLNAEMEK